MTHASLLYPHAPLDPAQPLAPARADHDPPEAAENEPVKTESVKSVDPGAAGPPAGHGAAGAAGAAPTAVGLFRPLPAPPPDGAGDGGAGGDAGGLDAAAAAAAAGEGEAEAEWEEEDAEAEARPLGRMASVGMRVLALPPLLSVRERC
jgi:hypothetical protein